LTRARAFTSSHRSRRRYRGQGAGRGGSTNDAAKDKAKLIASKVKGYDFRLPSGQAEILGCTITDLTDEQKS
jgi:hypothetical protein